jgi:hypothetical protein
VDVAKAVGPFEEQLYKKLRNQKKKLREIDELEVKMKAKDFKPNDAQKEKVASKDKLDAEYAEMRVQTSAYLEAKRAQEKAKKKEVEKLKKDTVKNVAQMICLSTVVNKGHVL